ncbi:hypothetical protein FB45DRAFT_1057901 [Roridomyces roridus]|uniref:Uncharacterized protein n=1 Tax=Roridomyces roridus TaxID=1738132 RepID=A0AAD7FQ66_9AGAR|nr:hypothetical protein FB45DRAFT_1057901 [Roridomyces roridus]
MASTSTILNVHTPSSSFAIVHALTQDSLEDLYDKLSRKSGTGYAGQRVGPGWLKYEWAPQAGPSTIWNLDDEADYTIFVWRQQQPPSDAASTSTAVDHLETPTLHMHDPQMPLPAPPAYMNASYYVFQPSRAQHPSDRKSNSPRPRSTKSRKTKGSKRGTVASEGDGIPVHKKEFEKFHGENGVRTVIGSIGPVSGVRMLLKSGYRHVYISRKFAKEHGFIPADAAPGHYGYGGLVNIGTWPITLTPSTTPSSHPNAPPPPPKPRTAVAPRTSKRTANDGQPKPTLITVYLSEEPHFDVVLGRSFFERRQIQTNPIDPTDVVCLDTGEKLECELVILKDGRSMTLNPSTKRR